MAEYIEREKLIERIRGTGYADQIKDNLLFIAKMIPAADVRPVEWISVKDMLPEEKGYYLVAYTDSRRNMVSTAQWQKKPRCWLLTGARAHWKVTHWMPLPEPPKEE